MAQSAVFVAVGGVGIFLPAFLLVGLVHPFWRFSLTSAWLILGSTAIGWLTQTY